MEAPLLQLPRHPFLPRLYPPLRLQPRIPLLLTPPLVDPPRRDLRLQVIVQTAKSETAAARTRPCAVLELASVALGRPTAVHLLKCRLLLEAQVPQKQLHQPGLHQFPSPTMRQGIVLVLTTS